MQNNQNKLIFNLLDLKKNLMFFYRILDLNTIKIENQNQYNFNDIIYLLNINIENLNIIIANYDLPLLEAALFFLEEKKKDLHKELEEKKTLTVVGTGLTNFEMQLLGLEIEHYHIVYCVMQNLKKKRELFCNSRTCRNFF